MRGLTHAGLALGCAAAAFAAGCGPGPPREATGLKAAAGPEADRSTPAVAERVRAVAAVDSVVEAVLAAGLVPGMSVAVVHGRDTLMMRGYGYADVERRTPMTARTVLPIGSIAKQFTAVAVLRLAEAGRLRLDDPVADHVPEVPPEWRTLRIHHL